MDQIQVAFSVILPVRNGGEYLKYCVNSILSQNYENYNLIILDNCSQDGSLEWLRSIQDNRIVIYTSDKSLSIEENWGRIVNTPKNEFITLIGHDDLLHPDFLKEMNLLIDKHPTASLYQSHFNYIDSKGNLIRRCQQMSETIFAHEFILHQLCNTIDSTGTGYVFRSKDYDQLNGMPISYPNLIYADFQLWVQLMLLGYLAISEKVLFSYRAHSSVSSLTSGESYFLAFEKYIDFLIVEANCNEEIKSVLSKYGSSFLMYCCESLSHRLLKTKYQNRNLKVSELINRFIGYAEKMIPGQSFNPRKKFGILLAEKIDDYSVLRNLFMIVKSKKSLK